jgi:DNA-binding NarL/FixJ family response regulator
VSAFSPHHTPGADDLAAGSHEPARTRPRLVIADDDFVIQMVVSASLEHAFDVVGIAGDGDAAIELVKDQQPDVILVDVDMPAGGGRRVVGEITRLAPRVAIVVLTADESDAARRELTAAGAVAYAQKGIDPDVLADLLIGAIAAHAGELARSAPERSATAAALACGDELACAAAT